jgi:hypothetical protein
MPSAERENLVRLGQLKHEPAVASEIRPSTDRGEPHALALAGLRLRGDIDEGLVDDLIKAAEAVRAALAQAVQQQP